RRAVEGPRADLRELAADLRIDRVGEERHLAVLAEPHHGAALREARGAARPLAGDPVAVRRIELGKRDLAFERGRDRPDLGAHLGRPFGGRRAFDLLAARNALLQNRGVVEGVPYAIPRSRDAMLAGHVHLGFSLSSEALRMPAN